jgi:hypothetical protein
MVVAYYFDRRLGLSIVTHCDAISGNQSMLCDKTTLPFHYFCVLCVFNFFSLNHSSEPNPKYTVYTHAHTTAVTVSSYYSSFIMKSDCVELV